MPTEFDQILAECKTLVAQAQISANQAAAAAASIGSAGLAPLESPMFTGDPRAPTPSANDISASIATTAWIGNKMAQPSGIATLDNNGLVPLAQLPFSGLTNQGTWNAATNSPTLVSGSGVSGNFYIVTVAGSTNLNGITTWTVGDWALFSSGVWTRVPAVPPAVSNLPLSSLAAQANNTVVANIAGGSASPTAITIAQLQARLSIVTTGGSGLCPTLPGGTGTFLRGDGTYATIPLPDLSAYATLASPAFTGTATVATQARNLNSSAIASTAFVIAQFGQSTEQAILKVNGTLSAGTSTYGARLDHIHPTDTSRLAAANGVGRDLTLSGTCTVPTQSPGDNSTRIASTAYVLAALGGTGASTIPSGTRMLFKQASAPSGWTKITTDDDCALRVVSGTTGGGSGGSVNFSTFLARTATDNVSLSIGNMPAHNHGLTLDFLTTADTQLVTATAFANAVKTSDGLFMGGGGVSGVNSLIIANNGSGTPFSPAIDCRIKYLDLIVCQKN